MNFTKLTQLIKLVVIATTMCGRS